MALPTPPRERHRVQKPVDKYLNKEKKKEEKLRAEIIAKIKELEEKDRMRKYWKARATSTPTIDSTKTTIFEIID